MDVNKNNSNSNIANNIDKRISMSLDGLSSFAKSLQQPSFTINGNVDSFKQTDNSNNSNSSSTDSNNTTHTNTTENSNNTNNTTDNSNNDNRANNNNNCNNRSFTSLSVDLNLNKCNDIASGINNDDNNNNNGSNGDGDSSNGSSSSSNGTMNLNNVLCDDFGPSIKEHELPFEKDSMLSPQSNLSSMLPLPPFTSAMNRDAPSDPVIINGHNLMEAQSNLQTQLQSNGTSINQITQAPTITPINTMIPETTTKSTIQSPATPTPIFCDHNNVNGGRALVTVSNPFATMSVTPKTRIPANGIEVTDSFMKGIGINGHSNGSSSSDGVDTANEQPMSNNLLINRHNQEKLAKKQEINANSNLFQSDSYKPPLPADSQTMMTTRSANGTGVNGRRIRHKNKFEVMGYVDSTGSDQSRYYKDNKNGKNGKNVMLDDNDNNSDHNSSSNSNSLSSRSSSSSSSSDGDTTMNERYYNNRNSNGGNSIKRNNTNNDQPHDAPLSKKRRKNRKQILY